MSSCTLQGQLQRAGCSQALCEKASALADKGRAHECIPELAQCRKEIVERARTAERQLACLDEAIRDIMQGET